MRATQRQQKQARALTQTNHVGRVFVLVAMHRKEGNDCEHEADPHHPKVANRPIAHRLHEHEHSAHRTREQDLKREDAVNFSGKQNVRDI